MEHPHQAQPFRRDLLQDAALTFAAVMLAFAALDDITTDKDASFAFERFALAACAVWLFMVAWRLVHGGHRLLGVVSVSILVASAAAQPAIGPGTDPFKFEYLVTVAGLVWFLGLAGMLVGLAWRAANKHVA
jgi:hypothetical protein